MAQQIRKVIHLEFREEVEGKKHYYFGSKSAIFQRFTSEQIGITYPTLRGCGDLSVKPYINNLCIIRQGELITSKSTKEE